MGIYTDIYTIHVSDQNRNNVEAAIVMFGEAVKVHEKLPHRIRLQTDVITAEVLSIKTGIEVYKDGDETAQHNAEEDFLHNPRVIVAAEKLAETAIQRAKINPVPPLNGQNAARYMAQTHTDIFNTTTTLKVISLLESAGARIHASGIPTLSVVFCDVANPEKLEEITLQPGWTLSRLTPPTAP